MLLHPFCIKLTRWSEKNRISHGGDVQDDFHDDLHDDPDLHDDLHDDDHQGVHQVTTNEDGSAGGVTPVRSQCHQIRWDQTNGRPAQPTPSFFLAQEQKLKWPSTKNLSSRGFFFIKGGEGRQRYWLLTWEAMLSPTSLDISPSEQTRCWVPARLLSPPMRTYCSHFFFDAKNVQV